MEKAQTKDRQRDRGSKKDPQRKTPRQTGLREGDGMAGTEGQTETLQERQTTEVNLSLQDSQDHEVYS